MKYVASSRSYCHVKQTDIKTRHLTATRRLVIALAAIIGLVASACGADTTSTTTAADTTSTTTDGDGDAATSTTAVAADDTTSWESILATADGQTVQLWMWGGDPVLNSYISDTVAPAVASYGVTLEQVRIEATSDGIDRIISEIEAGSDDGAVDLIWVNGKNFSQGQDAGLWRDDWVSDLPNATLLDPGDPTLFSDFGVATEGQEAPWSRAAFTFAHDSATVSNPPATFGELADWVEENPGRFTYPAPPDFTGSAFVRQAVQALGEEDAFTLLAAMRPNLWNEGKTFPKDEAELNTLFGNGQVDLALQNVSFLAMPANAGSVEGAMVAMNEMLSAELQSEKLSQVGVPAVVDIGGVVEETDYRLSDFGTPLEELPADDVPRIDERWLVEVLG